MKRARFRRISACFIGKRSFYQVPTLVPRLAAIIAVGMIVLAVGIGSSWAGPPFRTDDPEPVDYKHGEFYVAATLVQDSETTRTGALPQFEFNYGIVPNVQLHVIAPFAYNAPSGASTHYGYGDTELGVKYRFYNNEDSHFMVGTFPLVELPTGDRDRGLGTGETSFFIPLWLQKSWGPWQTYGGGGFWRNPGAGNKDYWFFGWQVQREMSKTLTLGAELFGQTPTKEDGLSETGFNVGAIVNITDDHHLLFSAGSDIHGENKFTAYLAYQYTFGPKEEKK